MKDCPKCGHIGLFGRGTYRVPEYKEIFLWCINCGCCFEDLKYSLEHIDMHYCDRIKDDQIRKDLKDWFLECDAITRDYANYLREIRKIFTG